MLDIKTDVVLYGSGTNAITVGCSDTINNLSGKDLWENSYVASDFNHVDITEITDEIKGPHFGFNINNAINSLPIYSKLIENGFSRVYTQNTNEIPITDFDGFIHLLWLVMPSTTNVAHITKQNTNIRVALDFNPHNISIRLDSLKRFVKMGGTNYAYNFASEPLFDEVQDGIVQSESFNVRIRKDENSPWNLFGNNKLVPCAILKHDDSYFVFDLTNIMSNSFQTVHMSARYGASNTALYDQCVDGRILKDFDTSTKIYNQSLALDEPKDTLLTYNSARDNNVYVHRTCKLKTPNIPMGCIVGYNYTNNFSNGISYGPITYGGALELFAKYGVLMMWNDTSIYKPIITDGVVTGYTSDLSATSDFDNYREIIHEGLPDKKPLPPDIDDTEKMNIGGFYSIGGLVNYYSLVNTPEHSPLNEISENLSNWDYVATGKDVLKNLISLKAIPISRENLCRGTSKHVIIAGVDTEVSGQTIDAIYDRIHLGTVSIPHRFNDFRDYAPYTKIEICAPFVGWMEMPSHSMGHTIRMDMTYDIVTGSCKVYAILDDNTIISEACGNIATDIPFSAEAVGMKTAQLINAGLGVAGSALSLGTGLVSGNIVGSASGIIGMANSITQTICSNNANYTEVRGNTGDSNNFYGVKQCYLKITYPVSHIPDNYGHTVGYLYNKNFTLEPSLGYTKISSPRIHGDMLENERLEILSLLESGVIL